MTLNEIRNAFVLKFNRESRKRKLNYEVPADREIALLISEGEQDVQRRLRIVESSATVTLTNGVGTLPANFGSIRGVKYSNTFLTPRSITDVRKAQAQESVSEPYIYALDTQSGSYQLLVYPTDATSVTVYYTVDSLYHQPSASTEYWGSATLPFNDGFSGNLILPNRYALAIQLYMLAQYFDEIEIKYERELSSLKHSRPNTLSSPKYNFGGLEDDGVFEAMRSQNASIQSSSGDGEVYTKHYIVYIEEGSTTYSTIKNTFGGITPSLASNVLTLSSSSEFTEGKILAECSLDMTWTRTSDSEMKVTIYPASGWSKATVEVYLP